MTNDQVGINLIAQQLNLSRLEELIDARVSQNGAQVVWDL